MSKATKLTGFQCPLELRKALEELSWARRTNMSSIVIKLIYDHLEKLCGPEFMKDLQEKAKTEDFSNIRLPDTIQTEEVLDDINTEKGWTNNFINTAFIQSEIKKIMKKDSSPYDKTSQFESMEKYFKACLDVVQQSKKEIETELDKQKQLVNVQEMK